MQVDNGYSNFLKAQTLIEALKRLNPTDMSAYYELIYAVSGCMTEQKDLELFVSFCTKIYNNGYQKSVDDHKEALEKQGLVAKVTF
jgi:hypothetical protein